MALFEKMMNQMPNIISMMRLLRRWEALDLPCIDVPKTYLTLFKLFDEEIDYVNRVFEDNKVVGVVVAIYFSRSCIFWWPVGVLFRFSFLFGYLFVYERGTTLTHTEFRIRCSAVCTMFDVYFDDLPSIMTKNKKIRAFVFFLALLFSTSAGRASDRADATSLRGSSLLGAIIATSSARNL